MKAILIFISIICCTVMLLSSCNQTDQQSQSEEIKKDFYLYIGTYTREEGHVDGKGEGIYLFKMDQNTGKLLYSDLKPGDLNPSYLTIHPNGKFLYAANEHMGNDEFETGSISAYSIEPKMKHLKLLNRQPAGGAPCYVSVDPSGKYVLAANYVTGDVVTLPIESDGKLGAVKSRIVHTGKGATERQTGPHAHMVTSNENEILAVDLGIDQIRRYHLIDGNLQFKDSIAVTAGSGPRHVTFHPNLDVIYVANELSGTIESYQKMGEKYERKQVISTLPEGKTNAACADIHITPDGRHLYASNRGAHNDLAMYQVDVTTGLLKIIGHQSTKGKTPRNFVIDPTGSFLLVANQDSDNVVTFRINRDTGELIDENIESIVPTPVCLKFLP